MSQQDNLYYGYKMDFKLVIRTFINSEFMDGAKDFIMGVDAETSTSTRSIWTDYFGGSDEDLSDLHKLRFFIQNYFNGDFFSSDENVSPIHLMPVECCGDDNDSDNDSDWVLGIKVGGAESTESNESNDSNDSNDSNESMDTISEDCAISSEERTMIEEIGNAYQFNIEPDFHYVNTSCIGTTHSHI